MLAAACLAAVALESDNDAVACAGWEPSIGEMTTFDPGVLGADSWGGLEYDPFDPGFGGACDDCSHKAMLADWHAFLGDEITAEEWETVIDKASLKDIFAREKDLTAAGKKQSKLYSAVEYVELLKRMEPAVTFVMYDDKPRPAPATTLAKELRAAQGGLKQAKEPFLQQRYAFAAVRAMFYRQDWPGLIAFYDKSVATLGAPSEDLKWRAKWYLAGALRAAGQAGRANLELARIHTGYYALAGMAVFDFKPAEEADWRESLRLAKDPKDKTALWSMVGIKHDPLVGAQEIIKIDVKSPLVPLLVVREIARVESSIDRTFNTPDKAQIAAQKKAYARVEAFATKLVAMPGVAKPAVYELILGHIAAKRGDVAGTRAHTAKAIALAPGDRRIASQAKASLAIALVSDYKINPSAEQELAQTMRDISPEFARMRTVSDEVRTKLAFAYAAANRMIDAEFLAHPVGNNSFDEPDPGFSAKIKTKWESAPFLKEMIARTDQRTTEFDRFVLQDSHVKADLQRELAIRYVLDGDFTAAKMTFETTGAKSELLKTDPFVIHVIDCHDCDHEKFGEKSKWTHKNLVERLVELDAIAKGGGEKGAQAALDLGNALYNITHHGNARTFTDGTHQDTEDARLAERYYKRVYDLSGNRELKAKAAWLAAKAELGTMIYREQEAKPTDFVDAGMMVPKVWFPIFKKFSNTKYYKEVLKECGRFSAYAATSP